MIFLAQFLKIAGTYKCVRAGLDLYSERNVCEGNKDVILVLFGLFFFFLIRNLNDYTKVKSKNPFLSLGFHR